MGSLQKMQSKRGKDYFIKNLTPSRIFKEFSSNFTVYSQLILNRFNVGFVFILENVPLKKGGLFFEFRLKLLFFSKF